MTPITLPFPNLAVLLAGLALAASPHAAHLPMWASGAAAILFAWRLTIAWKAFQLPPRWLMLAATVAGVAGDILTYRTIFGRDAGVTLLVLLLALKLMEMRAQRDVYVVTFLSYFLALTNFFYSQTIPTAALMLGTVFVITAGLIGFNATTCRPMENFRAAGALLVQAGPVMLLLFFLFPRVSGPLWGLPQDAFAAVTGLSDTMSPGTISQLSQSDAIAFRVKFDGRAPPRPQLYWRGPVFWQFDGRTWRAAGLPRLQRAVHFEALGTPVDYEITLEPHNRQWLFALDLPARLPPNTRITSDYLLLSVPPVRSRIRYELRSYPTYRATAGAEPEDFRTATAFPREVNPRAQNLAREWRRSLGNNEAIVRQGIEFLRAGKYGYTLLPPLLGMHTVDEFLFDTKEGFCEHFAASFVFLMRAAGVPARVVTGYQGGEINPVDGYMVVRQADAHAWAEVWLEDRGWVRVDPTAAAVPLRVDAGIAAAAPQSASLLMRTNFGWVRSLRDNWEALGNKWNQWVLAYNPDRQREMIAWFGIRSPSWETLAMALFWTVASVLGIIALWLFASYRPADPTLRIWLAFCRKLGGAGILRSSSEGPLDFSSRAAARLPARADAVRAIAGLYVELRYGRAADPRLLARLRSLVRTFQP
jgi:transglutaminase-like putative cysteine protease